MRLLLALLLTVVVAFSAPLGPGQITSLPGLGFDIDFDQYAGYVTVDAAVNRSLFYWFFTAQEDPTNAPVVAWFQGGPGCSSLLGLFTEHGPFVVNSDGATLSANPYSWNRLVNILYVESPAGVGFSYTHQKDYKTGDNQTMADAYTFLVEWFKLYPSLADNKFYISGESYGGHYVPQLAWTVLQNGGGGLNLQGILVGNPWTDDHIDTISVPEFVYSHALGSESSWQLVEKYCFVNGSARSRKFAVPFVRHFSELLSARDSIEISDAKCNSAIDQLLSEVGNLINQYDIYVPCLHDSRTALACMNYTALITYLNTPAVQQAINAIKPRTPWTECSAIPFVQAWPSVLPIYPDLMAKLDVAIYSGDVTFNVPFLGTGVWTQQVAGPTGIKSNWAAWTLPTSLGTQVAGYRIRYNGLTFITVRDAGHMVPQYQPQAAFVMLSNYLNGTL